MLVSMGNRGWGSYLYSQELREEGLATSWSRQTPHPDHTPVVLPSRTSLRIIESNGTYYAVNQKDKPSVRQFVVTWAREALAMYASMTSEAVHWPFSICETISVAV